MQNLNFKVIDLTHTLSSNVPIWDTDCGFKISTELDYKDCSGLDKFRVQRIDMRSGTGTHMDAPAHCIEGGKTIDTLQIEDLVTDCVVIDVSAGADENLIIMPEAVESFEKEHGSIAPKTFVIFYTGWSKYWDMPQKYRNNLQFPSVHEETVKLLLERDIAGLGTDTLSVDVGKDVFPVHRAILGAGKYLVENIANANLLPAVGAKSLVLPIKIKDGTEAPIRIVALIGV